MTSNVKAAKGYHRRIIRIRAEDSPNVRLAMAQQRAGKEVTNEILVPGVMTWNEYQKHRKLWDKVQQMVSLDAQFPKDGDVRLFPEDVLKAAIARARSVQGKQRTAKAMGVDSAEGGDWTVWTVVDDLGVMFQLSLKTKDTSTIAGQTIRLMEQYRVDPGSVLFDRGGGGKQHADYLRQQGHRVHSIGFGESASASRHFAARSSRFTTVGDRLSKQESQYAYKNKRAEMYGELAQLVEDGFAIPQEYAELIRQLRPLPKQYDGEGRLYLPPKDKPSPSYNGVTIKALIGRSPDEADSCALAVHAMLHPAKKPVIGAWS